MCQETKPGLASDFPIPRTGGFGAMPSRGPPSLHSFPHPSLTSSTMASGLLGLTVPQHNPNEETGGVWQD